MKDSTADQQIFRFMLDCIADVERFAAKETPDTFGDQDAAMFACIKKIEMLGEAAIKLSHYIKNHHPEIDWSGWIELRNMLVHEYFGVDDILVWQVIEKDMPVLKKQLTGLIVS